MEIIYVWIDEYKNIKKQGFNLSHKFFCEYNETEKELSIETKSDIKIFPENISFTAIVGQNGSGKTSLLEFMMLLLLRAKNNKNEIKGFAIGYDGKKFCIFYKKERNISFKSIKIPKKNDIGELFGEYYFQNQNPETRNIYYNPSFERISKQFLKYTFASLQKYDAAIYDYDFKPHDLNNLIAFPFKKFGKLDIAYNERWIILAMYKNFKILEKIHSNMQDNFLSKKLFFLPEKVVIKTDIEKLKSSIIKSYVNFNEMQKYLSDVASGKITIVELMRVLLLGVLSTSIIDNDFNQYFFKKNSEIDSFLRELCLRNKNKIQNCIESLLKISHEDINILLEKKLLSEQLIGSTLNIEVDQLAKFIDILREINHPSNVDIKELLLDNNINININIIEILNAVPFSFDVEVYDRNGVLYNEFSFGEKSIIALLNALLFFVRFYSELEVINIFIDEMEIGLSPEWQRKLISTLVEQYNYFLDVIKEEKNKKIKVNFFIATHSPFILSDIPKENVVFLENGKQVNKFSEHENTFGANIYDIFENGFFLENSIGKYSEEWIKAIDLILSFYNAYQLASAKEEKDRNFFPLRHLLKKWYVSNKNDGELSNSEINEQDSQLLKNEKIDLLKELFEKEGIDFEKYKFFIDENCDLKSEIKKYIEIIGDEVVREHLKDLYERVNDESK